ncbi:MAG: hypothetical protein FJW27_09875 [Acidimicrobiia bacterium]|nr:hypothetical protein [Acidimicrobiia bacterium]
MSIGNLTDRLRGIVKPARVLLEPDGHGRHGSRPAKPRSSDDGDELVVDEPSPTSERFDRGLDATLSGTWHRDISGARCYVMERTESADTWHGRVQVGAMAETLRRAEREAPLLANGAPARLPFVFFDLETTGLSGCAGTLAFLAGCGWFDDTGAFVSRQYILARTVDERAMLRAVAGHLDAAGALVSFNGRSFDVPLLESRFLYHRLSWTAGRLPHVDMLHAARRFWRADRVDGQPSSCSLGALERHVLGADRLDDVPGFEVPARFFQFVRSGDARPLTGVIEHNRLDLLSLAALTARLLRLINEGSEAAVDAREAVSLGRVFERAGLPDRAIEAYERVLTLPGLRPASATTSAATLEGEALRALAHLARRARRYDQAAAHWRQLLELPGCPRSMALEAAEALAIHHEHRTRDLDAARAFAVRTTSLSQRSTRGRDVLRRLARIDRKRAVAGCSRPNVPGGLPFA